MNEIKPKPLLQDDMLALDEPPASVALLVGGDAEKAERIAEHRLQLASIRKQYPHPAHPYKIGVYIRYYNQTRYEDYLQKHIAHFKEAIGLCPKWTLADFYIDEGQNAPNMANAPEWCRLLEDCFSGRVDLIITQRGFEITRSEFFENTCKPHVCFYHKRIKFSTACVRKFDKSSRIEMLINPISRKFAIRPAAIGNRNAVVFSKMNCGRYQPKEISTAAFSETVYSLFGWNTDYKYRILGSLYEQDGEIAYIFTVKDSEAYFKTYVLPTQGTTEEGKPVVQPLTPSGKRIRAIPEAWANTFGKEFYFHERSLAELEKQSEEDWMLYLEARIVSSKKKCSITGFAEIKAFIQEELKEINMEEAKNAR